LNSFGTKKQRTEKTCFYALHKLLILKAYLVGDAGIKPATSSVIAKHAFLRSGVTSVPSFGEIVIPMLAPRKTSCPFIVNGSEKHSIIFSAMTKASWLPVIFDNTIRNSSPPRRATVSVSRIQAKTRFADSFRISSPAI